MIAELLALKGGKMSKKWVMIAVAVLAGYVLSDQIAKIPVVNKLPTA